MYQELDKQKAKEVNLSIHHRKRRNAPQKLYDLQNQCFNIHFQNFRI